MDMNQFMALIRNLNPINDGFINFRQLLTYFILLCSPVPTEKQVKFVRDLGGDNSLIDRETFVNATFWFDESESSKDLPQHEVFNRKLFIKCALFDANAKTSSDPEGEFVNGSALADILRLPAEKGDFKEFRDFLFAPVNKVDN